MSFTVLDGCDEFYDVARERKKLPCRRRVVPGRQNGLNGFNDVPAIAGATKT
jgi:hypothetical protein